MVEPIVAQLERYMTLLTFRQHLTAANIANADTPGYKTVDIDFQTELRDRMRLDPPRPIEVRGLAVKNDGNNVDLDREARALSENALRFNVAAQILRSQIRIAKNAIQEGKAQ